MNEPAQHYAQDGAGGTDNKGLEPKSRPTYNASASEATRELRDTSRRRRDAEEKLQQHLIKAKEHVPHHHEPEVPAVPDAEEAQDTDPEGDAGPT
ncbi:hypothetical protein [Arthrobacter sp. UYCo732]|uniref:hypothetical protein n=1 Tax=Arthrobacter sp. UYCo732 TaxID=3156336 RepID=UPI0033980433